MALEIAGLQTKIQEHQKSQSAFTITDDEGRIIGEDLYIEDTKKKLAELEKSYASLYGPKESGPKPGKVRLGPTLEQEAFLKSLRQQTESVGMGPIGGLFAKADELNMGEKTHALIQKLGLAIQEDADQANRAKDSFAGWEKAFTFSEGQRQALSDLRLQTANLTVYREEAARATEEQKIDNEIRKVSITLVGEQKDAFLDQARVLQGDYMKAFAENQDAQRKWQTGFQQSMNNILDYSTNAATQINTLFTNAFKGMEDALVGFVKTGKLDFKSLADSIITEIIRIRVQQSIIAPLSTALGGAAGSSAVGGLLGFLGIGNSSGTASIGAATYGPTSTGGLPGRASGGDIAANQPYWVGEQGPELVIPRSSGTVVPNGAMGGGVHIENISVGSDTSVAAIRALHGMLNDLRASVGSMAVTAVASARQRGVAGLR